MLSWARTGHISSCAVYCTTVKSLTLSSLGMDLADVGERLKKETAVLFMIYYVTSFQCLHESLRLRILSVTVDLRDLKKKTATSTTFWKNSCFLDNCVFF